MKAAGFSGSLFLFVLSLLYLNTKTNKAKIAGKA